MSQVLLKYSNECPTVYRIRGTSCRLRPQQHGRCTWTLGDAAVDSLRCEAMCAVANHKVKYLQISIDIHVLKWAWDAQPDSVPFQCLRIYLSTFQLSTRANWSNPLWLAWDHHHHHPCIGPFFGATIQTTDLTITFGPWSSVRKVSLMQKTSWGK